MQKKKRKNLILISEERKMFYNVDPRMTFDHSQQENPFFEINNIK